MALRRLRMRSWVRSKPGFLQSSVGVTKTAVAFLDPLRAQFPSVFCWHYEDPGRALGSAPRHHEGYERRRVDGYRPQNRYRPAEMHVGELLTTLCNQPSLTTWDG